ncbi:MAG TPA: hypothetical protein VN874_03635 [Myxococcales bacterium]|nr:hypothetical protein [Myxococcales bacterium]
MRRTAGLSLLLSALALNATGCYKATFIRDASATRGVEKDKWADFFIFGLVGEETFNVRDFCPDGRVAEVRTGGNFGTGLVSILTLGIYAPRKVYVTCDAGRSASLEIDADAQGRPVAAVRRSGGAEWAARVTPADQPGAWLVSMEEAR